MEENINPKICDAISSKKTIQFSYEEGTRIVEPYCYGLTKNGEEVLRAFQIKGYSKSRNPQGWKLFKVSKIKNLMLNEDNFTIGHHYGLEPVIKISYCCI
jgi:predicted DNA-binding transcriptional regulator YafY